MMRLVAFLLVFSPSIVFARTRFYSLDIANRLLAPDGYQRSVITVNGSTPGPLIHAEKGDQMMIKVMNHLEDPLMRRSTTIHWHGIFQKRRAQDDGPAWVTQCPISPNQSYSYLVDSGEQAGTFWYHSHLSTQYIDGLRGPLIIYDPNDPHAHLYDVDDASTIITLTDWYQQYSEQLAADWMEDIITEPVPDSVLLNGIGRYLNGPKVKRAVITVEKGKRYRFRLINMSAIVPFRFAIEKHYFTVIEVDGINHVPLTVTSLSISAGQRYSIVVHADQKVDNYWIAFPTMFLGNSTTTANPNYNGSEAYAVLHYKGASHDEPVNSHLIPSITGILNSMGGLQEYQLAPLENPAPPGGSNPDITIKLNFTTTRPGDSSTLGAGNYWIINGEKYTPPTLPTLLEILRGTYISPANFRQHQATFVLPLNKTIEVQLIGDAAHPFHLHGHAFSVIQSATGPLNLVNPPIRDTVDSSNDVFNPVTIRFRTDNPGPWFLHCHKDWHLEAGLAVVFAEDPGDQRTGSDSLHPSKQWEDLCPIYHALPIELQ